MTNNFKRALAADIENEKEWADPEDIEIVYDFVTGELVSQSSFSHVNKRESHKSKFYHNINRRYNKSHTVEFQ